MPRSKPVPSVPPQTQPAAKAAPVVAGSDMAPVIYFDGAVACGTVHNVLQFELARSDLIPLSDGSLKTKPVMVAHLRCSPGAAIQLRDMIDRSLAMKPQKSGETVTS
jgi:hypothetical protein